MSYLALRRSVSVLVCSLTFATCALLLVAALSSPASAQTVTLRLPVGPAVLGPPPREVRNGTAKLTGHFNPEQMLRLVIALKPPHMAEEEQFLSELRDPRSPQFRKFLTKDEWNARYSPSEQDEKAVLDWATSQGLTITYRYPNRLMVHFEAPAATIEKAFKVTLNGYELPDGYSYFANDRAAVIPANLSNVVQWVGGLNNFYRMHPASFSGKRPPPPVYVPGPVFGKGLTVRSNGDGSKLPPSRTNGAPGPRLTNNFYDPTDLYSSQMYNYGALQNLGHCCNPSGNAGGSPPVSSIAIATFGEFAVSDIEGFLAQYPYLSSNIESIGGAGGCCDDETTLDTEWATAAANSLSGGMMNTAKVYVYEGGNLILSGPAIYNQILTDGNAMIVSMSWDQFEDSDAWECYTDVCNVISAFHSVFNNMVGVGFTLLNSSGDTGATADCETLSVNYPASDFDMVAVGGTEMTWYTDNTYDSEVAWSGSVDSGSCATNGGGSGGGCSNVVSYTGSNPQGTAASNACGSYRAVPDIALNSDANTGYNYYFNGSLQPIGGTSIATPQLAGFFAQEGAYLLYLESVTGDNCGPDHDTCGAAGMGNGNAYLYTIGNNVGSNLFVTAHYPFYDITSGCNVNDIVEQYQLTPWCAAPGYDLVTGWGSANMLQLAWSINYLIANDGSAPAITWNAPAAHAWYNSNQTVGWDLTGTSNNGAVPNGVAGYSSAWDADPGDQYEEPTPGPAAGNPSLSYYTGPQTPTPLNFAAGGLVLSNSLSQGCHTANVRAWDNAGISSDNTYGPVCWDTIVPHTTSALSGTHASGSTTIYLGTVTVTLTASDPGSSSGTGSGVATTYYEIDNGGFQTYNGPFSVTSSGFNEVYFYSVDKAGNVESIENTGLFQIITTSTTLTSSPNPSNYGQVVTFTATVTASNGSVPTGSVSFYNFTTLITTVTLNSSGVANGGTSTLTGGTRSITAKYNGASGKFPSSTSSALNQVVNALATTSHLTASPNPSTSGQSVAFTATVTSSSGVTPYGTVEFYNGTAVITGVNLNSSGVAVLNYANLTVGAHSITAKFLPTLDFAGSTSAAVSQVVNTITTNTVLENAPNPSLFGQSVTLTAIVLATNGPTPTGKATFYNGTTSLGSSTLNGGGVATLNTTLLPVGTDNLTVSYGGSTKEAPSTSAAVSQVVNAVTTTTALATSPNPSNAGQSVTMTATVTSATGARPTGLVYFYNGGVAIGSETLNTSGVATLSGAGLPTGTDSITATYVETASFLGSTSAAVAQVVNQVTTTTTLATSPNPSYNGGSVTMTATVVTSDGAKATGTVTFYNNGVSIGTGTLNASGVATLAYTRLPVGTDSITATYAGTALIVGSTSAAVSQVVNPVTTAATVTTSPNPSYYGQAVTFTATVTASNGLHPTGTVQFYYGTTFIGSETLSASAVATLSYAGMSAGTWNITAKYLGAGVYPAITSNAESQEVNQATTTTVLTTSPNPSAPGQSVAMTATVSASNGLVPTGAVQFYNSGTVITAVNLNASGVAVLNYTGLTNGPHSLTAVHLVNVDYAGSTSNAVSQLVAYPTTTVLTTSPNPSIVGQAITMTATVTASTGTPTGTVTFYNGASAIGTPQTLSGSGVATLGYSGLPAGTDSLTAVYNGSGAFAGSSSAAVAQVVNMATTSTALTTSPNPSTQGQAVTMTATVTCSSGMPTGTATFYNGATAIGTPQTLSGSGVATLSYAGLPAGTDSLTAAYPGMGSCGPSTSVPVSQVVSPPYTDNVLYTFAGQPDGLSSFANLIVDSLGNLYGTTYLGGTSDNGTVFELSPPSGGTGPWTETVLYSFTGGSDGGYPVAGLIFDSQGNLYGTTEEGGNGSANFGDGVAFELSPPRGGGSGPWNEVVLYAFCAETNCTDGERPYGGLVFDSQGNLYGTTNWGGSGGELSGAVFELSPPSGGIGLWTESVLYSFCSSSGGTCTDGERPYGSLIFDAQGNLYGTTELGGANSEGAVFELSPPAQSGAWTENVLYSFCPSSGCSDGYLPVGTLTFDSLGNLYGTTRTGGANGGGVDFELTPPASGATWTENVLYSFCSVGGSSCFDGGGPYYESLIFDSQGNLYGTTSGGGASGAGAVFEVSPPSGGIGPWSETVLYSFTGASDGGGPYAGLIFDSQGNLYGTTENSPGVVFALSPPATPKRR